MTKKNTGINLFKLFSMFMIALLHILGMGGIIEAATGTNGYYSIFSYRMRRSVQSIATHSPAGILCSAKK